jgi:hypothetical protein
LLPYSCLELAQCPVNDRDVVGNPSTGCHVFLFWIGICKYRFFFEAS